MFDKLDQKKKNQRPNYPKYFLNIFWQYGLSQEYIHTWSFIKFGYKSIREIKNLRILQLHVGEPIEPSS